MTPSRHSKLRAAPHGGLAATRRPGPMEAQMPKTIAIVLASLVALAAGCGGGETKKDRTAGKLPASASLRAALRKATASTAADFPAAAGRSLDEIAQSLSGTGTQVGLAGSVFVPGTNRLAFGVLDEDNVFVYGKTALYVANSAAARARGPFPAPADLLLTDAAFRSKQAATEKDPFAAVYEAHVPLSRAGNTAVLVVTKLDDGRLIGAGVSLRVRERATDPVVAVGAQAPKVTTDTRVAAAGNIKAIDTRIPADDMHDVNFADVVGKKPVALLFATPQLCQSRVCGPVVDIAAQLKATYGNRMTFIHQEVYKDNDVSKGLREPLRRFGVPSEPWLFVVDRSGKVTARLEGSFGFNAMKNAVESGLR
jgi:hypothetical protein